MSDLLPIWLPARIDEARSLTADQQLLLVGDHLNHFDLRPDNLQIGPGEEGTRNRAYVLDWNWATRTRMVLRRSFLELPCGTPRLASIRLLTTSGCHHAGSW